MVIDGIAMRTVLSVAQVEALRFALSEPGVIFLEQTKLLQIARSVVPDILNETVFRSSIIRAFSLEHHPLNL
jgi:hypothetical protein